MSDAPIRQDALKRLLAAHLCSPERRFRKCRPVLARQAQPGEVVVTIALSGHESSNTAKQGDVVVQNLTAARECYIVSPAKFRERYILEEPFGTGWCRYQPIGEIYALEAATRFLDLLGLVLPFSIEAPWGGTQPIYAGDYFASPLDLTEIYRIAQEEFNETYQRAKVA